MSITETWPAASRNMSTSIRPVRSAARAISSEARMNGPRSTVTALSVSPDLIRILRRASTAVSEPRSLRLATMSTPCSTPGSFGCTTTSSAVGARPVAGADSRDLVTAWLMWLPVTSSSPDEPLPNLCLTTNSSAREVSSASPASSPPATVDGVGTPTESSSRAICSLSAHPVCQAGETPGTRTPRRRSDSASPVLT